MNEYVDVAFLVVLSVHKDDVPTEHDVGEALWDGLAHVYDRDAIYVERKEKDA